MEPSDFRTPRKNLHHKSLNSGGGMVSIARFSFWVSSRNNFSRFISHTGFWECFCFLDHLQIYLYQRPQLIGNVKMYLPLSAFSPVQFQADIEIKKANKYWSLRFQRHKWFHQFHNYIYNYIFNLACPSACYLRVIHFICVCLEVSILQLLHWKYVQLRRLDGQ